MQNVGGPFFLVTFVVDHGADKKTSHYRTTSVQRRVISYSQREKPSNYYVSLVGILFSKIKRP